MMRSIFSFLLLGIGFAIDRADGQEFSDSTMMSDICCCCSSDDEDYSSTPFTPSPDAPFTPSPDAPFTSSPDAPISNITINEKVPSYCGQDLVRENVTSNMCEKEWKQKNNAYCSDLGPTFKLLKALCANDTRSETSLKDLTNSFENISARHSLSDIEKKKEILTTLSWLMEGISSVALSITFEKQKPQTVDQNSMGIQTTLISPESIKNNEALRLKAKGDQMVIYPRAVEVAAMIPDPIAVAFISYVGLESLLEETLLQNGTVLGNETLTGVYTMNSRLVSVFISNRKTDISTTVNLTFQHLKKKVAQEKVLCVHWISGALSDHGCQQLFSNITHTECSCQHLSSFAVLTATTHKQGDLILTIISYIGLSISIICLFLCIVTFLFCRSSHNSSTFIHLQLSSCLFFADLLFVVGIDKTSNKVLCLIIAGILKYLFLACFVWMFLEAVNLYLIVRNLKVANYSGANKYMKISMYLIGYGCPVLIVAISAAVKPGAFGTLYHCWLNPEFIWSFAGPICVIIVVNIVLFCLILKTLREKLATLNSEISSVKNTRSLMFKAIAHVFILGVTWCFGFFQYGPLEDIMAYMFTIFNSIQGIFIFLVHCLLNQKVREDYWRWIYCKKDVIPPVSEITMTSVPISNPLANEPSINEVHKQKIEWEEQR
ncbi:adhesion G protein-coupled receptor E3-like isoform X2 [Ahaetulla prasina]|uniref:adhesion G protein-coupled receptor E3-like isoform X2 n=1 Tax=Ahaetulla prasina TaxID=499056 RepID=UPI002648CC4A|nr:adhesion G protein-coupled receptor E3-like isoform X2 [Ahaetulla prasina]